MTCKEYERLIMLEQSGELPHDRQMELEQHLSLCESCHSYKDFYDKLIANASTALQTEPSSFAFFKLKQAINQREYYYAFKIWRVAFSALSAAAAIMLAVFVMKGYFQSPDGEKHITETYNMISVLYDYGEEKNFSAEDKNHDEKLRNLAVALLYAEGFVEDHPSDADVLNVFFDDV